MADVIIFQRHWQRRGDAALWTSVNPVLADGEIGYETDTSKWKFGDGVTAWVSLDYQLFEAPVDGHEYVRKNGAWAQATGGGGGGTDPSTTTLETWDFIREGISTSTATGTAFVTNGSVPVAYTAGAGAGASLTSVAGSPGICTLTTGTTTTGYSRMFLCPPVINVGGGPLTYKARIRIPTLSDGTNRFAVAVVMANVISGAVMRIAAIYTDNSNSGRWTFDAIAAGTTTTNTTIAPVANTWTTLQVQVTEDSNGTSAELFIDGVSASTVSSNIPSVALGLGVQVGKVLGTTARTVDVDYGYFTQEFTTPR